VYGKAGESIEKVLKRLDEVKPADVRRCIKDVFRAKNWASAAIVPKQAKISMGRLLEF
jgi:hypothetical protein